MDKKFEITFTVPMGVHKKSKDIFYNGNFVNLTICTDCKRVWDYWSNNSRICEECGGQLQEEEVGKWHKEYKKWFIRETK
jgi:rRNA maturation endonuclease Nob1